MRLAKRMSRLGTETAFEVLVRAKALEAQGRDIVHLEIGEPDFDTPLNIVDAAADALHNHYTHYVPAAGLPELRHAIASDASMRRGITFDPDNVVVTPGGKPVMFFAIMALVDAGDQVIYPNPGFPIYESMIRFVGARPVPIPLREERDFALDVDRLVASIGPKTRLIVLNSPHNPTGGVLTRAELERIAAAVRQYPDIVVLSDEIYSRMIYEGEHTSIAALPGMLERTIVLDGFSKIYAMTGWRLGYGLFPGELAPAVARLMTNSNSCTAAFTQVAGVAALTDTQTPSEEMVEQFRERRGVFVAGLNEIPGITCRMPHGAFYVFPNIIGTGMSSREVADLLLYEAGVATLAGTSFGAFGEGYIRLSYANSVENLLKALERIAATLTKRLGAPAPAARASARATAAATSGANGRRTNGRGPTGNGKASANGARGATASKAASSKARSTARATREPTHSS